MKIVKSINDELVYSDIDPKNLKQFKKAGWTEVKETQIEEPEQQEIAPVVKNTGGRPKKPITNI